MQNQQRLVGIGRKVSLHEDETRTVRHRPTATHQDGDRLIVVPVVDDVTQDVGVTAGRAALPRGQEAVLLVEDEEEVRRFTREVLERLGYTVLEAIGAKDAVVISERHLGVINVLLTDVVMPQISGRELAEAIAGARPETRLLFMSGYTDDAIVRHGVLEAGIKFREKPFSPQALAVKVREVLDLE